MKDGSLESGCKKKHKANFWLGSGSAYDEIRRKSGPKRGYVKALEARLGLFDP